MPLYITVSAGPRADVARPLLALSDQALIRQMLTILSSAFDVEDPIADAETSGGVVLPLRQPNSTSLEVDP